jgi:L-iditol 2-dehydrogenase
MGHEFSGVVVQAGQGVKAWKAGDRVVSETEAFSCGKCRYCLSGATNLCPERMGLGYAVNGAFAQYIVVREKILNKIPDTISFSEAAICEPLANAVHIVLERTSISPDDKIIVIGPGTMGLLVMQVVRTIGSSVLVVGTETSNKRLTLAENLGAEKAMNLDKEDPWPIIQDLTQGYGADLVFECSGTVLGVNNALKWTRKGGKIVQVGLLGKPIQVNYEEITFKELQVIGSFAQNHYSWVKAIELLAQGKVKTKPLISGEYPIGEWRTAFEIFEKREGLKYLLYFKE